MSNWGLGNVDLADQGFNRRYTATVEIPEGAIDTTEADSTLIFYVTATDDACNHTVDSALNPFAVDNQLPVGTAAYAMQKDVDVNNIANINDSVKMTVTIDAGTTDLAATCPVMVDLQTSGLGGSSVQCIETIVADDYVYKHKIIYNPQFAQYAVEEAANTHHVTVTLTDDAGNTNEITSSNLLQPIDTKPPLAVILNNPEKGACAINLSWTGHAGDRTYRIYSDGGDGSWESSDTINYVGTALFPATTWSTDEADTTRLVVEDGMTYQFVVKVIDESDNKEYYTNFFAQVVSSAVDCQAPTACVDTTKTKSGGYYGKVNGLDLIVTSTDPDIQSVAVKVRDADLGSGIPGPWHTVVASMTQVGGGGTFTAHLDSAALHDLGVSSGFLDDTYELITVATDEWGNTQTNAAALEACVYSSPFTFHWFWQNLPLRLVTVNDTVSPQNPSCGYNVLRDDSNVIVIDVDNFVAGDSFTVDVQALGTGADYRVFYKEGIATMPYTVYLNATNFPKGSQDVYIFVTRNDGNDAELNFEICVPDLNAPMATIVFPLDGEIVPRVCNHLDMLEVVAEINSDSYDPNNVTRVEFEELIDETWTRFDIVTTEVDNDYVAEWFNCAYNHGDTARLRAVIFDNANNTFTTDPVFVTIDTLAPDISLSVPQVKTSCGVEKIGGIIDLAAKVNTVYEDVVSIDFYYASADDPDLVDEYYHHIGRGRSGHIRWDLYLSWIRHPRGTDKQ